MLYDMQNGFEKMELCFAQYHTDGDILPRSLLGIGYRGIG
jgi:hypothetical protein